MSARAYNTVKLARFYSVESACWGSIAASLFVALARVARFVVVVIIAVFVVIVVIILIIIIIIIVIIIIIIIKTPVWVGMISRSPGF